jgi:hypothetical protein
MEMEKIMKQVLYLKLKIPKQISFLQLVGNSNQFNTKNIKLLNFFSEVFLFLMPVEKMIN